MKKSLVTLLIACTLLLSACTRKTVVAPTSPSPSADPSVSPVTAIPPITSPDSTQSASDMPLMDGTYRAEVSPAYAAAQGHGWTEYLKITVSNQQITEVEFDGIKNGQKKSEVSPEEYPMTPPPSEWIPKLNEAIRAAEIPEAMDTISGATMSSAVARQLYTAVLRAAREGNSETVIVEIP